MEQLSVDVGLAFAAFNEAQHAAVYEAIWRWDIEVDPDPAAKTFRIVCPNKKAYILFSPLAENLGIKIPRNYSSWTARIIVD